LIDHSRAVLHNGLGQYEPAFDAAQRASKDDSGLNMWSLPTLVEAAAHSGRSRIAADAVEELADRTRAAGTKLALGIEARSRALVSDEATAEDLYVEAIDLLEQTSLRLHRARTQVIYGEWLRRANRRVDARQQLRAAHETFTRGGAEAFAEGAGRELLATGETARRRAEGPVGCSAAPSASERLTHAVEDVDRWLTGKDKRAAAWPGAADLTDLVAMDGSSHAAVAFDNE
jgi:hypothetical protein